MWEVKDVIGRANIGGVGGGGGGGWGGVWLFFFFFNDTATTEIYTLSLHDALPIFSLLCWLSRVLLLVSLVGLVPRAYRLFF